MDKYKTKMDILWMLKIDCFYHGDYMCTFKHVPSVHFMYVPVRTVYGRECGDRVHNRFWDRTRGERYICTAQQGGWHAAVLCCTGTSIIHALYVHDLFSDTYKYRSIICKLCMHYDIDLGWFLELNTATFFLMVMFFKGNSFCNRQRK